MDVVYVWGERALQLLGEPGVSEGKDEPENPCVF